MARIRSIKPEFFTHYDLYQAEKETGLPLRVAFAGLWTQADREGRFKWVPPQLKLGCLPYDEIDFSRVLDALITRGFIVAYASNQSQNTPEFGWIPSFTDHQVINNREKASSLPVPNENNILTREPRVDDALTTCGKGKGKEGKGKEGNKSIAGQDHASSSRENNTTDADLLGDQKPESKPKQVNHKQIAKEILEFLNEKCGKNYQQVDGNLDFIISRLKEGYSPKDLARIIIDRYNRWHNDDEKREFLRPSTLFNKTKCAQYMGELPAEGGNHG